MMKKLNEIPGKNPFKVPENYFEDVTRKIISETSGSESGISRRGTIRKLKPLFAVAASIAAFILISYTALKIFIPGNTNHIVSEISEQEFYETYLNDIDLLTLEEQAGTITPVIDINDVNTSELTDYLLFININENEIYEFL